ncbi:MAG: hypothetical protein ABSD76_08530 [Terriglobales bacterium]|jgi:hypothetical protein
MSELIEFLAAYRDAAQAWERSKDKSHATADKISEQLEARLRDRLPEKFQVTRQSPEEVIYPLFSASMGKSANDADFASGLLEKLHWLRHREPFWVATKERANGSRNAIEKFHGTLLEYDRLYLGGERLPKSKVDYDHDVIFSTGWGLGLENLTEEEDLAELFDELCPCKKVHDGHALRMQRDRMFKALAISLKK